MSGLLRFFLKAFSILLFFAPAMYASVDWVRDSMPAPAIKEVDEKVAFAPQANTVHQYTEPEALDVIIVQVNTDTQTRRLLQCPQTGCQIQRVPQSLSGNALFDGGAWYHYVEEGESEDDTHVVLKKTWPDTNQTETIVEQTALVKPRGLSMSPDGTKVAYWLDNISSDKNLTELWVYDSVSGGTSLVGENIGRLDVRSSLRWSQSGTLLWFLGNNGTGRSAKLELVVLDSRTVKKDARFLQLDWEELYQIADRGPMDISDTKPALIYGQHIGEGKSELIVVMEQGSPHRYGIDGDVRYVQWLNDGRALYAVQKGGELAFWRLENGKAVPIARMDGTLHSAHMDAGEEYVGFIAANPQGALRVHVLQLATGLIRTQGEVPPFGNQTFLVRAEQADTVDDHAVAGITTKLSDEELTAFVTKHISELSGVSNATPVRLLTTTIDNSVFVDYQLPETEEVKRLLVTIRDAVHVEWSIRARYEQRAGEWEKVQGGGLKDPEPLKLYEWEPSLKQWFLKQEAAS